MDQYNATDNIMTNGLVTVDPAEPCCCESEVCGGNGECWGDFGELGGDAGSLLHTGGLKDILEEHSINSISILSCNNK